MRFKKKGWLSNISSSNPDGKFMKMSDLLSTCYGFLLHGSCVVVPTVFRPLVLQILDKGHFGFKRMINLARTYVYWPNIYDNIVEFCRRGQAFAEHQNAPSKTAIYPRIMPEKLWSGVHMDHAANFWGSNSFWWSMRTRNTLAPIYFLSLCIYSLFVSTLLWLSLIKETWEYSSYFSFSHHFLVSYHGIVPWKRQSVRRENQSG